MTLNLYLGVLYVCLAIGLLTYKELSRGLRYMWWYALFSLIVELVGLYVKTATGKPDPNVFIVFQIVEYFLVSSFFLTIVQRGKMWILTSLPAIFTFNLIALAAKSPSLKIYSFQLGGLFMSAWSMVYFFQIFKEIGEEPLERNPNFWVAVGIVFFYCGSFFIYGYASSISKYDSQLASKIYDGINHILNCVYYGLITYGFVCQRIYRS